MNERRKLWLSIGAALWAGSAALTPAIAQEADADEAHSMHAAPAAMGQAAPTSMGEGEGAESVDLLQDDRAFLERLGLIRGHLRVGNALYQAGHTDMSATHMKHPRDELYAGLVPAIRSRGANTFDAQLTDLAEAVESGADATSVQAAWQAVDAAIQAIETAAGASIDVQLLAISDVLRTAGEEYALGVVDGRIANSHEFQDAWGFTQVASQRLGALAGAEGEWGEVIAQAIELVDALDSLWPSLAPEGAVEGRASELYGAAARVELLAYRLQR